MRKKPICVALEGETIEALDERAKVEEADLHAMPMGDYAAHRQAQIMADRRR
jgi:hypothetical protein